MELRIDLGLATPEGVRAHTEWLNSEMTKKLLSCAGSAVTSPAGLSQGPQMSEMALYNYGIQVGMSTILDFLKQAPDFALAAKNKLEQIEPESTYGADMIVGKTKKGVA